MKIDSLLATKGTNVITILPSESIRQALVVLAKHNVGALVVVNESDALVGILSERDIAREAMRNEHFFDEPVSRLMTSQLITGSPGDDLDAVLFTMVKNHFRHLPIVEQGKLVGIVTIGDVVKARLDQYQGEMDTLEQQLTRG